MAAICAESLTDSKKSLIIVLRVWLFYDKNYRSCDGFVLLIFVTIFQGKELSYIVPLLGLFAAAAFRLMPSFIRIISSFQLVNGGLAAINLLSTEKSKIENVHI